MLKGGLFKWCLGEAHQLGLDELVDDKVHHCLADAKVAGRDAFVESLNAALCVHTLDALPHRHLHLGIVIELQSRLDKPNGIRRRGRDKAGAGRAHDVHQRRVALNETENEDN